MGKRKLNVKDEAISGNLPKDFKNLKTRDYYGCVLVSFRFRGIPQRAGQQPHYVFGGRAEVSFKAYALNDEELKKIDEELESSDLGGALDLIEGATTESIENLQEEITYFLEEKEDEEDKGKSSKEDSPKDTSNPFKALFGGYNDKKSEEKKEDSKPKGKEKVVIKSESFAEKTYIRPLVAKGAIETTFSLFDIYKKAHGMASFT